jgi:hypothetical protein
MRIQLRRYISGMKGKRDLDSRRTRSAFPAVGALYALRDCLASCSINLIMGTMAGGATSLV